MQFEVQCKTHNGGGATGEEYGTVSILGLEDRSCRRRNCHVAGAEHEEQGSAGEAWEAAQEEQGGGGEEEKRSRGGGGKEEDFM